MPPDVTHDRRGAQPSRPEIAQSWRRAELYGLNPAQTVDRLTVADIDRRSRLMRAATPVLDEIALHLADTGFCVVLADRDSRIVSRRFGTRSVERVVDGIGIGVGCRFVEKNTGTNAIATPFELRKGIAVHGPEHYLDAFKKFTCYGHPILHPVTRRIEGVLDITCLSRESTPLLGPFLRRAVGDIERRLLDGAREADRRLFAAFQAAQHRASPVLALGDGVVLASAAAAEILDAADYMLLRELMSQAGTTRNAPQSLRLASGTMVDVRVERIAGSSGALFEIFPVEATRRPVPRKQHIAAGVLPAAVERELREYRLSRSRVSISGEPGTGRTTSVRYLAGDEPVALMDAADVPVADEGNWCARLERLLATHPGLVAVESVHLLSPPLAVWLAHALDDSNSWVAVTGAPPADLAAEHAGLMARFVARVELPPLRCRRNEVPALARTMLAACNPGASSRFAPQALRLLESQLWPGNLRELEAVVRAAAQARSAGDIVPGDLPAAYREHAISHRLSAWEQAEHDAIIKALHAFGGNKVHAAEHLGISRSTLYNRMRSLGITGP
ncbi:sigma-54-dependent Fis family transcriptional regulator [Protofrankia symbiont of Coriaria ruscifolia]|uniref:sigma-54-dependent Fis family transcriptional regulator n=1 Tax=Protofrankia symbiont of Coriaria ruscifolia TaxID=1306542 RepID=UPI001040F0A1|nr:helix-turn-helix domain-containing protein [Protofrankia symbiont of Coriaria ruscifolia]